MLNNPESLELVLSRLKNVRRSGSGHTAQCPCPDHADNRNSLSISRGYNGQALLYCHAGCPADAVLAAMGLTWRELYPQSLPSDSQREKVYDYLDAQGTLVYQVVRKQPKGFAQRRPDPKGGYLWNVQGVSPLLYRLPELFTAPAGSTVYIPEGEQDVDRLASQGLLATTNSGGAGKWRNAPEYNSVLQGLNIVILPDNDYIGKQHASQVANILGDIAATVKILNLPGLPQRGDVSDWLDSGRTIEDLLRLEAETPAIQPAHPPEQVTHKPEPTTPNPDATEKVTRSQSTILLELIEATDCEYWHNNDGVPYITVTIAGHQQSRAAHSKQVGQWLGYLYYTATGRAASNQALQDVLSILAARGLYDGPEHLVYTRVAKYGDGVMLDLANDAWQAVHITSEGWQVVDDVPVKFRRPDGMLALPTPQRGGSIEQLRPFVNLADDRDWAKLLAYLVSTLNPVGPYPLLPLHAEQGSAKSTTARLIKMLLDPNTAPLRSSPRDERDLSIAARNNWILAYDNLSGLQNWFSDALCRISTGGGFATRELHSDDGEVRFDSMRPVILTGIEDLTTRSDLLSRSLTVSLPAIPECHRRSERELLEAFRLARPYILGALLSAVSTALLRLDTLEQPSSLPRMADAALWARAAEPALGLADGTILAAYQDSKDAASAIALEASLIAPALREFSAKQLSNSNGADLDVSWKGTATDLLAELNMIASDETRKLRAWPRQANRLSSQIRRLAPDLRAIGIDIRTGERVPGLGTRLITIGRVGTEPPTSPAALAA